MRAALALLVGCTASKGADSTGGETADPTSGEFSVLTYNVHGLPPSITGDDTAGRLAQIGPLLPAYDLVCLQEDWDEANHDAMAASMGDYPTALWFGEPLDQRAYGSGLSLFSRATSIATAEIYYDTCYGALDHGSDCLASKGVLMSRLALAEGAYLDVYDTHFEAGGDPGDDESRAAQVDVLIAAVTSFSAGQAVLFMGDTNLGDDDPDDLPLIRKLEAQTDLLEVCDVVGCPDPGRIDRIFLRSGEDVALSALGWSAPTEFVDADGVALSDHDPIAATIGWSRSP